MKQILFALTASSLLLTSTISATAGAPMPYAHASYERISPQQAKAMMDKGGVVVIDVREPDEFATGHVQGAINIPLSTLRSGHVLPQVPDKNATLLLQCRSGVRAEKAAQILIDSGYQHVYNFLGVLQWPYGLVR